MATTLNTTSGVPIALPTDAVLNREPGRTTVPAGAPVTRPKPGMWISVIWSFPGRSPFSILPYSLTKNWCRPNNPDCTDQNGCECAGHAYYKLESQVVFYRVPNVSAAPDGTLIPGKLHLVGNHPNPFNPSTTIQYHLAEPGDVTIAVYDAQGKMVCEREFNHPAEGGYFWTWNGRGVTGELLSSGIYLYEIRHGQERVSSKMVLLK